MEQTRRLSFYGIWVGVLCLVLHLFLARTTAVFLVLAVVAFSFWLFVAAWSGVNIVIKNKLSSFFVTIIILAALALLPLGIEGVLGLLTR